MSPYVWLALVIIFLILELFTLGLSTIWFAGGSLVAFFLNLASVPVVWQIVVAIVVSFLLMLTVRPYANKKINNAATRTNADRIVGMEAIVTETIDNIQGTGCVKVEGLDWMARTEANQPGIQEGTMIRILRVEGVKVIVEPATK
jgi:membrane protein implicated in regulation of membrane protease activity